MKQSRRRPRAVFSCNVLEQLFPDIQTGAIAWSSELYARVSAAEDGLVAAHPEFRIPSPQRVLLQDGPARCAITVQDRHTQSVIDVLNVLHPAQPLATRVAHLYRYYKIKDFLERHMDRLIREHLVTIGFPKPDTMSISMDLIEELVTQPYSVNPGTPRSTFDVEQIISYARARRSRPERIH